MSTSIFPDIPVELGGSRSYDIVFRPIDRISRTLEEACLGPRRCLVVTDETVATLHLNALLAPLKTDGWRPKEIILPPGERTKAPEHLADLYEQALGAGIDRKTPVLAFGGGVVVDLAGYAAATLLRGLPFVQVPTTLIAQVDSAIGGKTGLNHHLGKNLIGAFHQPRCVYTDLSLLQSLPEREWMSGLAEVVKHALIADETFFGFLSEQWDHILAREPATVGEMVHRAASIKAAVVAEDEREQGGRAILNFGHTFGHAIENVAGYGRFTHGEAVALGMRAAVHLSARFTPNLPATCIDRLLRRIPVAGVIDDLPVGTLIRAMQSDKKVDAGTLRFVLLSRLGEAVVRQDIAAREVEDAWRAIRA